LDHLFRQWSRIIEQLHVLLYLLDRRGTNDDYIFMLPLQERKSVVSKYTLPPSIHTSQSLVSRYPTNWLSHPTVGGNFLPKSEDAWNEKHDGDQITLIAKGDRLI